MPARVNGGSLIAGRGLLPKGTSVRGLVRTQ